MILTLAICCFVVGFGVQFQETLTPYASQVWEYSGDLFAQVVYGESKPVGAVIVYEKGNADKLTTDQLNWIMDKKLRSDCKAKGFQFAVADPDDKDKEGNCPPKAIAPYVKRAIEKGLPRLVLIGPRGGITDFVLPANETDARKRLGVQP
jgi:hypothetical protein